MKINFCDAVDIISGGTPKTDIAEYWDGNIPWLSVVDFGNVTKYVYKTEKHITALGVTNSSTKILEPDDIIISARGTVGAMAMLACPMAFNQSCFGLRAKKDILNQHFLFYYLKFFLDNIKMKSQGSVFSTINLDTFKMIELNVPEMDTQKRIADLLSSIDETIINNNSICSDLESMAKLLYDYWFVQFDFPDENGKPYKSSGGKMVWNEELKREIPEGWAATDLCKITSHLTDGEHGSVVDSVNSGYYLLSCKNISGGSLHWELSERQVSKSTFIKMRKRTMLDVGDVLISSVGTVGEVCLLDICPDNIEFQRSVAILKPDLLKVTSEWLYETLFSMRNIIKNAAHGAVQQCIFISDISALKSILPPKKIIDEYTKTISSGFRLKTIYTKENQQLASLRDFLLPMLMNGQVKVGKEEA